MDEPVVFDTSVLISLINEKKFESQFLEWIEKSSVFVSIVTANELLRGCHDGVSRRIVREFLKVLDDRVVTPTRDHWMECAEISEQLLREQKRTKLNVLLMQNDLLIALAARQLGARLVTSDRKDFMILKGYVKVSIDFW